MAAAVTYQFQVDLGNAPQGFQEVVACNQKLENAVLQLKKASLEESAARRQSAQEMKRHLEQQKEAEAATRDQIGAFKELAGAVGGAFAGGLSLGAVFSELDELDQRLEQSGRKATEIHRSLQALASIQDRERGPENLRLAQVLGAQYGVGAGESADLIQQFQSKYGSFKEGIVAAKSAFELKQLDPKMETAAAADIINFGAAGGLKPGQSTAVAFAASQASKLSLAEYAAASRGAAGFKDPYAGAAAVAALSYGPFNREELPTFARGAGMALNAPNELTKGIAEDLRAKGRDWKALTEFERLNEIAARVPDTSMSGLMEAGLTDQEKARGLSVLIAERDRWKRIAETARATPESALRERTAQVYRDNPPLAEAFKQRQLEMREDFRAAWGEGGLQGQQAVTAAQESGEWLKDKGLGVLTSEDKPGRSLRMTEWVLGSIAPGLFPPDKTKSYPERLEGGLPGMLKRAGGGGFVTETREQYEARVKKESFGGVTSRFDVEEAKLEELLPRGEPASGPRISSEYADPMLRAALNLPEPAGPPGWEPEPRRKPVSAPKTARAFVNGEWIEAPARGPLEGYHRELPTGYDREPLEGYHRELRTGAQGAVYSEESSELGRKIDVLIGAVDRNTSAHQHNSGATTANTEATAAAASRGTARETRVVHTPRASRLAAVDRN